VAVVGPSGAGKSTLLRLVAGLLRPAGGRIAVGAEMWFGAGVDVPPERRRVGFVFQDYALFPHLSVRGNVAFGAAGPVDALLDRLGIAHLAAARPRELSGGERQRVALARALARDPAVLLLDEPLAALDPETRAAVADELAAVVADAGVPALVVTHRYDEAVQLAPEAVVLERGRVVQAGATEGLVRAPASPFVAALAGVNYLPGTARGTWIELDAGGVVRTAEPADGRVAALVAPWDVILSLEPPHDDSAQNHLAGTVGAVVAVGARARVTVGGSGAAAVTAEITAESAARLGLVRGTPVVAAWKATATRVVPRP
jgi:molybdate transport system ATP-binding protein